MADYEVAPLAECVPVYDDNLYIAAATPVEPPPVSPSFSRPSLQHATALNGGRNARRGILPQGRVPRDILNSLQRQGFTEGLAEALMQNKEEHPLNFWIVDNSGSMFNTDGHRLLQNENHNTVQLVQSTRWAEMQQTVEYHAEMAALLKHPTVFRMLNDPGRLHGPQQFSICVRDPEFIQEDLEIARKAMRKTSPSGVTLLTEHLQEIRANIVEMQERLQIQDRKVVIVIATDGTPSDSNGYTNQSLQQQFAEALRALQLPVWLVVRLCTDDKSVVKYWNNLDSELELDLEVLDDYVSEAREVYVYNKWLNYGLPIHRMREMGYYHRLFDLLDERKLLKSELYDFFQVLFGEDNMVGVPDAQADWDGFLSSIRLMVESESRQWNPITKRMEPWINLEQLDHHYRTAS